MGINQLISLHHLNYEGEMIMMYDIEAAYKNSSLTPEEFEKIKSEVRSDFPNDEMMFELHVIRILNAIKKGHWQLSSS